jgi:hypothetical protein
MIGVVMPGDRRALLSASPETSQLDSLMMVGGGRSRARMFRRDPL